MKTELSKIAKDLEQGNITENEARTLLLGLLIVSDLLPSNEEIERIAWNFGEEQVGDAFNKYKCDQSYSQGAKWMRDLLIGNNR